jgi:hypothetical protein
MKHENEEITLADALLYALGTIVLGLALAYAF